MRNLEAPPAASAAPAATAALEAPKHATVYGHSLFTLTLLIFQAMGKLAEAEPFYQRALAVWKKALGPDHPHVAIALNNLASLLQVLSSTT